MANYKVEKISEPMIVGEGPHWDHEKKVLYFTDIHAFIVYKYDPSTKSLKSVKLQEPVSIVIPVKGKDNQFIITLGRKVALLTWDGVSDSPQNVEVVVEVDKEEGKETNRINDGKADPSGRVWAGTMGPAVNDVPTPERGIFFSVDKSRTAVIHQTKIGISNGITWSLDNNTMYYIDSVTRRVDAFDFDLSTGKISNRRAIFDFESNGLPGFPDGQTTDTDGNLWIACYNGHQVIQVDPKTGKLLRSIELPSLKVTSVAFGGPALDELFVTSAGQEMSQEQLQKWPLTGCTFRVTGLGVRGLPGNPAEL